MKRHVYLSVEEVKRDQITGFVLAVAVNIAIYFLPDWFTTVVFGSPYNTYVLLLPWVANIVLLMATLLIRPQMGLGYLAAIGCAIGIPLAVGAIFVVSCFVGAAVVIPFAGSSVSAGSTVGVIIMFVMVLVLGIFFVRILWGLFRSWQEQTLEWNNQPSALPPFQGGIPDPRAEPEKEKSEQRPDQRS